MNMRRALFIAVLLVPGVAGSAAAQFQPMPQQQQEPPCFKAFSKLRDDAQHKGERHPEGEQEKG